jgi:uncharacterized cupin superfamily protein
MPKIDPARLPSIASTGYLPPYDRDVAGRSRVAVGAAGGLDQFGANLVRLEPGAWSSQRHWHMGEDELVVMLTGTLILVEEGSETPMHPGDIATFKAGVANGHHLQNRSNEIATFLAVGTDSETDICHYPDCDMHWSLATGYIPKSALKSG